MMTAVIKIATIVLNFIYFFFKLLKRRNKVVLISRQSNSPSLDITMVRDEIIASHKDYKVAVLCKTIEPGVLGKISYVFHMITQMYHIATSKAVVLDSYCILISLLTHNKDLLVIQMWHSVGTMKKFGYSILDQDEGTSSKLAHGMKMHKNYDFILAAGQGYTHHLAEGFNYPKEQIVIKPLPRVELLKSKSYGEKVKKEIYSKYPELKSKKNIVYCPTFRKDGLDQFKNAAEKLADKVDYDKYNLIIKPHPLTGSINLTAKAIVDYEFSSFEMLFASDIVISDYSCIIYEAAILGLPIYMYTYDYDEYMSKRDIYMDYITEIPGPICRDPNALIESLETDYNYERLSTFLYKYVNINSPSETRAIVDFIFEQIAPKN